MNVNNNQNNKQKVIKNSNGPICAGCGFSQSQTATSKPTNTRKNNESKEIKKGNKNTTNQK